MTECKSLMGVNPVHSNSHVGYRARENKRTCVGPKCREVQPNKILCRQNVVEKAAY